MEIRNIANLLKSTVSISLFNKGLAGKIFDDVKKNGTKIVIKNIAQDNGKRYSQKQIMEEFGISEDDLNEEEIEFE